MMDQAAVKIITRKWYKEYEELEEMARTAQRSGAASFYRGKAQGRIEAILDLTWQWSEGDES